MISNTDFEKLWFMYQTDGASNGITINTFCNQNGVPYSEFEKWYKKTHRVVEKLEVTGIPDEEEEQTTRPTDTPHPNQKSQVLSKGDFTYIVFLAVYGVDTVLTIMHRIMLHENLGEAHRKHAFQLMANELGMEHTVVSAIYTVLQLAISVVMLLIPNTPAWHWGYLIGVCVVLAVAYLLFMKKYYHLHEEYLKSLEK